MKSALSMFIKNVVHWKTVDFQKKFLIKSGSKRSLREDLVWLRMSIIMQNYQICKRKLLKKIIKAEFLLVIKKQKHSRVSVIGTFTLCWC